MDRRDDLAAVDSRLPASVLVLVQSRLPGAAQDRLVDAGEPAGEDHPLRGGARDPRLERPASAHRFARPALLCVLPSRAGRRALDFRRGRAHARHPGGDRPDFVGQREPVEPERATTAVFYSISNCQRGLAGVSFGHFLIKQVVEEIRRELPRLSTFVTLSPAPNFAEWLKRERATEASRGARRGGPRRHWRRSIDSDWWRDAETAEARSRAAAARRRLVLSARAHAARHAARFGRALSSRQRCAARAAQFRSPIPRSAR